MTTDLIETSHIGATFEGLKCNGVAPKIPLRHGFYPKPTIWQQLPGVRGIGLPLQRRAMKVNSIHGTNEGKTGSNLASISEIKKFEYLHPD